VRGTEKVREEDQELEDPPLYEVAGRVICTKLRSIFALSITRGKIAFSTVLHRQFTL